MIKLVAIDAHGKRRKLEAERIEIELSSGRRLLLDAPHLAWGDLDVLAEAEEGTPMLSLQPMGCNLVTLRATVQHEASELAGADLGAVPPVLELEMQRALTSDDKLLPRPGKKQVRRWAQAALACDATVTVRLVGEEEGRQLNRDFRGKDYATNVLTFVYGDEVGPLAGDLVLCVPVVVREAIEQGKAPDAHYAHLVVHGLLHLQGHDHENDADAAVMEAREREVLAALGYSNPYA